MGEKVIPLVEFFNKEGLSTTISCQVYNKTNMSMFWIQFDKLVTENDIVQFQLKHLDNYGTFVLANRFVQRFYSTKMGIYHSYQYLAATIEAA